jgi:hypothetical protein
MDPRAHDLCKGSSNGQVEAVILSKRFEHPGIVS